MEFETLSMELADGVATITLDRPDAFNAMNEQMSRDLYDVGGVCGQNKDIRAVIITGDGDKAFCAGGDVASFATMGEAASLRIAAMATTLHNAVSRFAWMRAPTIAAVNGVAAGAGLSLMAACDLAVAADHASFTSAYTRIGMTPDGSSTYYLPKLIGHRRTMELYLTNRLLSAEEALDWGLLNRVVPAADLMSTAQEMAAAIAAGAPLAHASIKQLLNHAAVNSLETQLEFETRSISAMAGSRDGQEGFQSFVEKRPANFVGD